MPWNSELTPNILPVKVLFDIPVWVYTPSFVIPEIPVKAPVLEMSQSEVLISPVSPLSPRMNRPAVWKLSDMEALPSKWTIPSTSRASVIRRWEVLYKKLEVVVPVPNLEYAADEKPPTCKVFPVRRYDALAVP